MAEPVTPTPISPWPTAPTPLDTPEVFNERAFNQSAALQPQTDAMNVQAGQNNQNAQAAKDYALVAQSALASAQTLTAFKGAWSSLTGPLNMPATVLHNGAYWVLLQNVADVTAVQPGTNSAIWLPQILEARTLTTGIDLNMVANSGSYIITSPANGPTGVTSGLMNVTRGGAVMIQEFTDASSGGKWLRYGSSLTTTPVFSAWGRQTQDNTPGVALAGGAMDCSKGTYFTETVNGARTLTFANIPATGAYACVLEINHISGSITLPAGSVWVAGAPPTLNVLKRHLLYFQRALTGTGGWIVSALPNSAQ